MGNAESTCWTLIRGAVDGSAEHQDIFARRYGPVARAYFAARWRGSGMSSNVEDAGQMVLLECFRPGGVLDRADPAAPGGFRAFLFGVIRNIALRIERKEPPCPAPPDLDLEGVPSSDEDPSSVMDDEYARAVVREALEVHAARAEARGAGARQRVQLLRERFYEDRTIREIAELWGEAPARLHHEFARAKREFQDSLFDVVLVHHPGCSPGEIERECRALMELLRSD